MLQKIQKNLKGNRYQSMGEGAFLNIREGWIDYYLTDHLMLSHRCNEDERGELPERLHAHDYYELTIIAAGEAVEYIADGKRIAAKEGMAILTKPGRVHMYRLEKPIRYERFVIYFKDPECLFAIEEMMDFIKEGNDFFAAFRLPAFSISHLSEAADALEKGTPMAASSAYLAIGELFLKLSKEKVQEPIKEAAPHFIGEIKDYIDSHFLELPSASALCERFFYSREYISRSFRRYYNTPIYDYILQRKLLYCRALLEKGAGVESAARKAGFGNLAGFGKLFKKHYGCTPSEYKKGL